MFDFGRDENGHANMGLMPSHVHIVQIRFKCRAFKMFYRRQYYSHASEYITEVTICTLSIILLLVIIALLLIMIMNLKIF